MTLRFHKPMALASLALAAGLGAGAAQAADQLRIVGSSTVYPFSSYVAEELGVTTEYQTPVVESTGTGGGMQLFCAGDGPDTPDITNASRPITVDEFKMCMENGVTKITEIKFGYDGIVIAQNKQNPEWDLTLKQMALALAAKVPKNGKLVANPYDTWNDIDSSLPEREILIFGPPKSSGTRDVIEEKILAHVTKRMGAYDSAFTTVRDDGKYVPTGENDNLIVQRLAQNRFAIGLFGYSFLVENKGLISAIAIGGVEPKPKPISTGKYPLARSLYFYTKNPHVDDLAAMAPYVNLFLSNKMIGPQGALTRLGLIPLPQQMRQTLRQRWEQRVTLTLAEVKGEG